MTRTWSPTVFSSPAMVYDEGRREGGEGWGGWGGHTLKGGRKLSTCFLLLLPGASYAAMEKDRVSEGPVLARGGGYVSVVSLCHEGCLGNGNVGEMMRRR